MPRGWEQGPNEEQPTEQGQETGQEPAARLRTVYFQPKEIWLDEGCRVMGVVTEPEELWCEAKDRDHDGRFELQIPEESSRIVFVLLPSMEPLNDWTVVLGPGRPPPEGTGHGMIPFRLLRSHLPHSTDVEQGRLLAPKGSPVGP